MSEAANYIPVSKPELSGNEARYVTDAIESTWISSTGKYVERFEKEFAELVGSRHAVAICNGTAALHVALLTLGLQPDDEVLLPSFTFVATANAVRYVGAKPIFIDIDEASWCLDPNKLEGSITPKTRGIIAVHLYGHPANMDAINKVAALHGLWVVEDAAEALGARYKDRSAGSLGHMATFSFYGNKIISSGEGGAITFSDDRLLSRAKALRGQGVDPDKRYFFPIVGYNYRLTNVACAILCAQLERLDRLLARRHEIYAIYQWRLASVNGAGMQPKAPWVVLSPWLFCLTVNPGACAVDRDGLMLALKRVNIDTRPFFIPIHTLPPYAAGAEMQKGDLAVTQRVAATGLNLPTFPAMRDDEVHRVCDIIVATLEN